jgi:hypothetical protein
MKSPKKTGIKRLEKGQFWKVDDSYIHIVELGKRLAHYKQLRSTSQKGGTVKMLGIEAIENYLRANRAKLVNAASN